MIPLFGKNEASPCEGRRGFYQTWFEASRVCAAVVVLTLLAPICGLCENWPRFRGPNGQGISAEKNLPLTWDATKNIIWKTEIPGLSWSSPIVWEGRVFVTTALEDGVSCHVLSLDAVTGRILWDKEVFKQSTTGRKEARNTYATPTPVTDGKRVYAAFFDGSFAALDFDGNIVWINRQHKFYSQHGLATSPIIHDGLLIQARDGSSEGPDKSLGWQKPWDQSYVLALEADTGKERWRGRRGWSRISHGTPALWNAPDGRVQVISEAGDVVQGFDALTGERIWTSTVIGEGKAPSVVLGDGLVFTAGGWGGRESIKAFKLGGQGDLKETNLVWEQKKGMPKMPSMIYLKPYLFAITDNGIATCMNGATGEIVWQERLDANFSASPVAADGRIYFLSDAGEGIVIEAGPKFKILARNPLGEKVQASMAVSGGRFYIRTARNLYCIGAEK